MSADLEDPAVSIELPSPVTIELVRDHPFKKKPTGAGCAACAGGKLAPAHLGAPPSLNTFLRGRNPFAYAQAKDAWEQALRGLLDRSGLPKGLASVRVEGWACFAQQRERDEGNFRFLPEKALGDALVAGGWLPNDSFYVYQFDRLHPVYVKGEKQTWTRLLVTPQLGDFA